MTSVAVTWLTGRWVFTQKEDTVFSSLTRTSCMEHLLLFASKSVYSWSRYRILFHTEACCILKTCSIPGSVDVELFLADCPQVLSKTSHRSINEDQKNHSISPAISGLKLFDGKLCLVLIPAAKFKAICMRECLDRVPAPSMTKWFGLNDVWTALPKICKLTYDRTVSPHKFQFITAHVNVMVITQKNVRRFQVPVCYSIFV